MNIKHLPVMAGEVLELLSVVEGGIYVDATVGLGGHTEGILAKAGQQGRVIGVDRDTEALKMAAARLSNDRLTLKKGSFSDLEHLVLSEGFSELDGILFDLGVSMLQFRDPGRGFSFNSDARLDMRMDPEQEFTAWDVINEYPEHDLVRILKEYGEEHRAARIVRSIVYNRRIKQIETCRELADIVYRSIGRSGRLHPATKTFQALRIEVNHETDQLKAGLAASMQLLRKGGRLCVISYHSLEDRIVKNFVRDSAKEGLLRPLSKKPLSPGRAEILENPSSRSAKLRGAERI